MPRNLNFRSLIDKITDYSISTDNNTIQGFYEKSKCKIKYFKITGKMARIIHKTLICKDEQK